MKSIEQLGVEWAAEYDRRNPKNPHARIATAHAVAEYWLENTDSEFMREFIGVFILALDGETSYQLLGVPPDELRDRIRAFLNDPKGIRPSL